MPLEVPVTRAVLDWVGLRVVLSCREPPRWEANHRTGCIGRQGVCFSGCVARWSARSAGTLPGAAVRDTDFAGLGAVDGIGADLFSRSSSNRGSTPLGTHRILQPGIAFAFSDVLAASGGACFLLSSVAFLLLLAS